MGLATIEASGTTPEVYERLRRVASASLARERADHTLQPTALVHEAYVRLAAEKRVHWHDRAHFVATAAMSMRRILVDHARARIARGGEHAPLTLSGAPDDSHGFEADVLDLEEALHALAERSGRQARIVELRFFAGSTIEEVAEILELSTRRINEEWRVARAWLRKRLGERSDRS